jgi:transcriptional regulator with XRE-family HTH domain
MVFNEKLREMRKKAKLSQQALAEKAGLSRRSLQYYESGQIAPDMETLRKLCSVLQCSIRELVEETPSDTEDFRALAQDMALAFSGGKISEADRDAIFEIIQDAYEKSKAMNEKSSRKNHVER